MRLIDADALIVKFKDDLESLQEFAFQLATIGAINTVKHQSTVDAVPVIRCKDCKRLGVANMKDKYGQPSPIPCCRRNGHIRLGIKPDDYCSRAERKEE